MLNKSVVRRIFEQSLTTDGVLTHSDHTVSLNRCFHTKVTILQLQRLKTTPKNDQSNQRSNESVIAVPS